MDQLPLSVTAFAGGVPRLDPRLLTHGNAALANNGRYNSGAIEALREPKYVTNPTKSGTQLALYRLVKSALEAWLTWDRDVDSSPGPIAQETTGRTYFTGDGEPRVTNYDLATTGGTDHPMASYVLGVFAPTTAPTVTPSGGVGAATSRSYRYTFLTQWGEESAPSPVSALTAGKVDDTWALTSMQTAPANSFSITAASWSSGTATVTVASTFGLRVGEEVNVTGVSPSGYNGTRLAITALTSTQISYAVASNPGAYSSGGTVARVAPHNTTGWKQRIYRLSTAGPYKLVVEQTAAATYNDTVAETLLGADLATGDWEMPPVDMKGLVDGWNGMMFGFSKNDVYVCIPYQPHAWPSRWRHTLTDQVVGIGVSGQTLVVGTSGPPRRIVGSSSESLSEINSKIPWPCLSKRGLASGALGVFYPTKEGLVRGTPEGFELVTRELYSPEAWRRMHPETFVAAIAIDTYHASYDSAGEALPKPSQGALMIPLIELTLGEVTTSEILKDLWTDHRTGKLYVLRDNKVHEWDASTSIKLLVEHRSKTFALAKPTNPGAAKVDADWTQTDAEIATLAAAKDLVIFANHVRLGTSYTRNVTASVGSAVVTPVSTADLVAGMLVTGTGVPAGTTILSIIAGAVTLSAAITSGPPTSLTFAGAIYRVGSTTNGSAVVTGLSATLDLYRGLKVTGTGIPANTFIRQVDSNSQITLHQNATGTASVGLTFTGHEGLVCGAYNSMPYNAVPINGSCFIPIPAVTYDVVQFLFYDAISNQLKFSKSILPPGPGFQMPGGYQTDAFYFAVVTNLKVRKVAIAQNMKQLERV